MEFVIVKHTKWKELYINDRLVWEGMDYDDKLILELQKLFGFELIYKNNNLGQKMRGMR